MAAEVKNHFKQENQKHRVLFSLHRVPILSSTGIFSKTFKHPMVVVLTRSKDHKMDSIQQNIHFLLLSSSSIGLCNSICESESKLSTGGSGIFMVPWPAICIGPYL